jgi:CRP-like cAMP-binding protein
MWGFGLLFGLVLKVKSEYAYQVSLASFRHTRWLRFLAKSDSSGCARKRMGHKSKHPRNTIRLKAVVGGHDGHRVRNAILLDLPRKEFESVFSKMELVQLPTHTVLNDMAEPIEFVYFVNSGLASILNVMSDGKSVEVGLSGKEGFVGLPLIVGFGTSPTQVVMQIAGSGFKLRARDMVEMLPSCPKLEKSLNRYSQELALQVTQVAACNRLHEVEERLARWLLMSQDRVGVSSFPLTQEFLAHMLGTRRASVTVAAGILQKAGLITYKRGQVKIEKRADLEDAACECYNQLAQQMKNWHHNSHQA